MRCICFGSGTGIKRSTNGGSLRGIDGDGLHGVNHFSFNELRSATDDFHASNMIGRGGFGTVYKGILRDGKKVAVKTLSAQSKQGVQEFLNEINTISKVRHPNLVELIGCCVKETNRILVYEYVENSSIDRVILGESSRGLKSSLMKLDWNNRSAICLGIAKGLAFLHEEVSPHIVHRDIKASNILLDKDLNPKIGDFGLAKLFPDDITHISTRIAGTTGYLAPEYALGGQLTSKADVYSFGVVLLEIVSGRSTGKAIWLGKQNVVLEWAWRLYQEGKVLEVVDPELGEFPEDVVIRHIKVAFFCTQAAASRRPVMSQVVDMLSKDMKLNDDMLTAPGFFFLDSASNNQATRKLSSHSSGQQTSTEPAAITELSPR